MKKRTLILLIILILCLKPVLSGNTHYLNFSEKDSYEITINERDVIRFPFMIREYTKTPEGKVEFTLKEVEQKVMLRSINTEKNIAELTIFLEGAETPFYQSMNNKMTLDLDFERDGFNDISIRADNIKDNATTLLLSKEDESKKGIPTSVPNLQQKDAQTAQKKSFWNWLFGSNSNNTKDDIKEVKNETIKEPETLNGSMPGWMLFIAKHQVLSIIILVALFILAWNQRSIRRSFKRHRI